MSGLRNNDFGLFTGGGSGGTPSGVSSVGATPPITSSGGANPNISTSISTNKLLGRSTAGTGVAEEITLGTGLTFSGTTLNAAGGGLTRSINTASSNTTAGNTAGTDYVYLVTGAFTITLPTPVSNTNSYTIKRTGAGVVEIATTSGTIDGTPAPISINVQFVSLTLISDGTNWFII